MKTINLYVTKTFVFVLLISISIITFAMMLGSFVKMFELLSKGMPVNSILMVLVYSLPLSLSLAIPFGTLVTIILVFGQMSSNNEITAMRACGISIMQIIAPIIIIVFGMTIFCAYLQLDIAPVCAMNLKVKSKQAVSENPLTIFEPGREVMFNSTSIFIDDRFDETGVSGVEIFEFDSKKKSTRHIKPSRHIKSDTGHFEVDKIKGVINLHLENATIMQYEGKNVRKTITDKLKFPIEYNNEFKKLTIGKKYKFMSLQEIYGRMVLDNKRNKTTTRLEIELNKRIAMGLSPIAFLFLGLPLAIRTSRKETSFGIFVSIILGGIYYSFMLVAQALHSKPELHPQSLLWIPCILYQLLGMVLIYRMTKR